MKTPILSKRLERIPVSAVRKLTPYAQSARAQGVKICHLNIGDPDIETPEVMMKVLHKWNINPIRYAQSTGEPEFLKAFAIYYQNLGYSVDSSQILATVGGSEAVVMALFGTCARGEEILVFEPFYSNYAACAAFCDVKLIPIPTSAENGFHLPSVAEIEKKISKKTRAILFCSPGNPTGTVYSQEEIELLVAIAKKHGLFLISDEVYREYIFDGKTHTSLLSYIQEIPDNAVVLDSLSKRYSLCGARLGAVVSLNQALMRNLNKIAHARLSGGIIDQMIGAKMNEVQEQYIENVRREYQKRRDILYEGLMSIPGVFLTKPEGAFYTMVTLPVKNAEDFCIFLLRDFRAKNETVMLAPGAGFYQTENQGVDQVRIAYVLQEKDLKKSIEIIGRALDEYKRVGESIRPTL